MDAWFELIVEAGFGFLALVFEMGVEMEMGVEWMNGVDENSAMICLDGFCVIKVLGGGGREWEGVKG